MGDSPVFNTIKNVAGYGVGTLAALTTIKSGGLGNYLMNRQRMLADPGFRATLEGSPFAAGMFGVSGTTGAAPALALPQAAGGGAVAQPSDFVGPPAPGQQVAAPAPAAPGQLPAPTAMNVPGYEPGTPRVWHPLFSPYAPKAALEQQGYATLEQLAAGGDDLQRGLAKTAAGIMPTMSETNAVLGRASQIQAAAGPGSTVVTEFPGMKVQQGSPYNLTAVTSDEYRTYGEAAAASAQRYGGAGSVEQTNRGTFKPVPPPSAEALRPAQAPPPVQAGPPAGAPPRAPAPARAGGGVPVQPVAPAPPPTPPTQPPAPPAPPTRPAAPAPPAALPPPPPPPPAPSAPPAGIAAPTPPPPPPRPQATVPIPYDPNALAPSVRVAPGSGMRTGYAPPAPAEVTAPQGPTEAGPAPAPQPAFRPLPNLRPAPSTGIVTPPVVSPPPPTGYKTTPVEPETGTAGGAALDTISVTDKSGRTITYHTAPFPQTAEGANMVLAGIPGDFRLSTPAEIDQWKQNEDADFARKEVTRTDIQRLRGQTPAEKQAVVDMLRGYRNALQTLYTDFPTAADRDKYVGWIARPLSELKSLREADPMFEKFLVDLGPFQYHNWKDETGALNGQEQFILGDQLPTGHERNAVGFEERLGKFRDRIDMKLAQHVAMLTMAPNEITTDWINESDRIFTTWLADQRKATQGGAPPPETPPATVVVPPPPTTTLPPPAPGGPAGPTGGAAGPAANAAPPPFNVIGQWVE